MAQTWSKDRRLDYLRLVNLPREEHPHIWGKAPPLTIFSSILVNGLFLAELNIYVAAKILQNGAKITWGIWTTSDKHWKVQKVTIGWATFVQKDTFLRLKHYIGFI